MEKKSLILIIIFLGLVSTIAIFDTYSIYRKEAKGNGTVRTSIWKTSLNQEGVNNTLTLVSGKTSQNYTLKVESTSEVDVKYSIEINNIPSGVEVSLDGGTFKTPNNDKKVTFTGVGTILYSSTIKEKTHTLTFKSNLGTEEIINNKITINVITEQVM